MKLFIHTIVWSLVAFFLLVTMQVFALDHSDDDKKLTEKCKAGGGCFMVTEDGFKKAMMMAFEKGQQMGGQVGYQYGLEACKNDS